MKRQSDIGTNCRHLKERKKPSSSSLLQCTCRSMYGKPIPQTLTDATYSSFITCSNRLFRPSFFLGTVFSSAFPPAPAPANTSRARLFLSLRRMASPLHLGLSRYCRQSQTTRLSRRYRKDGSPGKAPGFTAILRCLAARTLTALVPARISSCRRLSSRRARCPSHPSMSVQHLMQASWEQALFICNVGDYNNSDALEVQ